MTFQLDPRLTNDSVTLGDFDLCRLLLMNDCQFPWFTLVPMRAGLIETYDLETKDFNQLWLESRILSKAVMKIFEGEKLNVAAIGNIVTQLHLHHVVRYSTDICWPAPIWGKQPMLEYSSEKITGIAKQMNNELLSFGFNAVQMN